MSLWPQVPWLHQRQPRVLRRKRDCTLPSSLQLPRVHLRRRCVLQRREEGLCATPAITSEEEGQALLLTTAVSTSEEEAQALLLTAAVSTSEEEGQALLLTMSASTSEEEGQALLFTMSVRASEEGHPKALARISKVESSPMSTKKILVDHERGQNNDKAKFVTVNKWQKKDICKAWNDSRGCEAWCPQQRERRCDIKLERSGLACGSRSHNMLQHDARQHGQPASNK